MGRRASKSFNTRQREQKERMRKRREIQKLEREKEKAQDPKESLRKSLLLVPVKKKVKAQKKKIYIRKNIDRDYKPSTKIHVAILKRMFKMTRLRVEAKAKKEARANKTSKMSVFVKKRVKMTKSIQSKADNHTESRFKTVSDKNAPQPNKKRIETNIDKDYRPSTKMPKVIKKTVFKMTRTRLRKNNAHNRTIKTEKENENMITVTKMGTQTNSDQPSKKRVQTINDIKEAMTSAKKRKVIRVSDDRSFRRTRTRMSAEIDNEVLNVPINNDQDSESVNENVETVDGMRMRKSPKRRMGPYIEKKHHKQKKRRRMDKNFESMIKKIQEDIDAVSDVMAEQLTIENRNLLPTKDKNASEGLRILRKHGDKGDSMPTEKRKTDEDNLSEQLKWIHSCGLCDKKYTDMDLLILHMKSHTSKDLDSEESTAPEQSQKKKRSIHIETSSVVKAKELETSSVVKTKKLKNKVQNKNASEGLRILRKQASRHNYDIQMRLRNGFRVKRANKDLEESTAPEQSQKKKRSIHIETSSVVKAKELETSSVVKTKKLKNKVQNKNASEGLRILRKHADKGESEPTEKRKTDGDNFSEQSSWIHGCGLCDKKYTEMDSLILHMKSHTSKDLDSEESTVPKQSPKKTSNLKKKRTHIETSSVVKAKGLKNKVQSNTCTGLNPSNRKYRDSESTTNDMEPQILGLQETTEEQSLTIVIKKEPVETDDVSLLVFNPLEKNSNLNQQSQASSSNNRNIRET